MWRLLLVVLCGCVTTPQPSPEEQKWRAEHPYAACVKDAAAQRRKCIMSVALGGTGPGILTAFTGVESKRDPVALEAGCNADYSVAVQVCDAEAR